MKEFEFTTSEAKKTYVRDMFSGIAERYDFLNHLLSFGLDFYWRRKAVRIIKHHLDNLPPATGTRTPEILDIACGTGDLSFEILKQIPNAAITGIDLAKPMLELFAKKASEQKVNIAIEEGDVETMRFSDHSFDAALIGFGTRNFSRLDLAFEEIQRVLKPGGIFVNLELSRPRIFPVKACYDLYSAVVPALGKLFSKKPEAYSYLPDSIRRFPGREKIISMLYEAGFEHAEWKDLSAGIVTMHIGTTSSR